MNIQYSRLVVWISPRVWCPSVPATKLLASSKVYNAEAITGGLEAAGLGGEVVIEANHQVRLLHSPRPVSTKQLLHCGCCCQATKINQNSWENIWSAIYFNNNPNSTKNQFPVRASAHILAMRNWSPLKQEKYLDKTGKYLDKTVEHNKYPITAPPIFSRARLQAPHLQCGGLGTDLVSAWPLPGPGAAAAPLWGWARAPTLSLLSCQQSDRGESRAGDDVTSLSNEPSRAHQ